MNTFTFTPQQQEALDFYSEFADKVKYFGLTIFADREERLLYRQGKKLVEQALNHKNNVRVTLTEEELLPVFEEYLRSYTSEGQVKVFDRKVAASGMSSDRQDPIASAMAVHGQLVYCDTANDTIVKSFDRMGKTIKGLMSDYNNQTGTARFDV